MPPKLAKDARTYRIAQEFRGWTLEYIESLDEFTITKLMAFLDGQAKAMRAK